MEGACLSVQLCLLLYLFKGWAWSKQGKLVLTLNLPVPSFDLSYRCGTYLPFFNQRSVFFLFSLFRN